jgi:hypothetical protein
MAASNRTIQAIVQILIAELGYTVAKRLVFRIQREVDGNTSFRQTMLFLANEFRL